MTVERVPLVFTAVHKLRFQPFVLEASTARPSQSLQPLVPLEPLELERVLRSSQTAQTALAVDTALC